jgi:hypothetical protein
VSGLQALAYGSNPPDLMIQEDVKSLITEINQRLNISLDSAQAQFEGFYKFNGTSYDAIGTIRNSNNSPDLFVKLVFTCSLNSICIIINDPEKVASNKDGNYTILDPISI